jgi:hypothetical protein
VSDRELLEAAARAAGYVPVRWTDDGLLLEGVQEPWNAMVSDADALRLAVKLRLGMHFEAQQIGEDDWLIVEVYSDYREDGSCHCETHELGTDPCAATRRAIVRAAAAMAEGAG